MWTSLLFPHEHHFTRGVLPQLCHPKKLWSPHHLVVGTVNQHWVGAALVLKTCTGNRVKEDVSIRARVLKRSNFKIYFFFHLPSPICPPYWLYRAASGKMMVATQIKAMLWQRLFNKGRKGERLVHHMEYIIPCCLLQYMRYAPVALLSIKGTACYTVPLGC